MEFQTKSIFSLTNAFSLLSLLQSSIPTSCKTIVVTLLANLGNYSAPLYLSNTNRGTEYPCKEHDLISERWCKDNRFARKSILNFARIGNPCLRTDETNPRIRQKICAPFLLRNEPEIFCIVLIILMACSATLFVKGTWKSYIKASTACLFSNRSRRFFALLCLIRPFFFFEGSGNGGFSANPLSRMVRYFASYPTIVSGSICAKPALISSSFFFLISYSKSIIGCPHIC